MVRRNPPTPAVRIAYLTANYPNVAHAFIQGEILALERAGAEVLRVALNPAAASDILTDVDRKEQANTFYVKALPKPQLAWSILATVLGHPVAFARCAVAAFRGGRYNLGLSVKLCFQLLEALVVWRHCRKQRITAIHAHFGQAPASVAELTAAFGNALGKEHWTWSATIHGSHEFFNEDTSRVREKVAAADLIVCISDFTRAQLMRIAQPEDWQKVAIVRCGIDLDQFPARPHRAVGDPPVIVTTARLSREKGHLVLVEAVALLRDLGLAVRVRLLGTGPFQPEIEAAIDRFGVEDAFELVGAKSPAEVSSELRDADVFCLPTFFEGLPISIMEAMAIGIPVVTTYVGGIPELVVDGETGWVVPAGNAPQLAEALRLSLTDPDLDVVVSAAYKRVRQYHERAVNVAELLPLLRACHT